MKNLHCLKLVFKIRDLSKQKTMSLKLITTIHKSINKNNFDNRTTFSLKEGNWIESMMQQDKKRDNLEEKMTMGKLV